MRAYRIAKDKYINDLSGTGAKLYGGRWNEEGTSVLYTSTNLSLAVLELLANHVWGLVKGYSYVQLQIPDELLIKTANMDMLSSKWRKSQYSMSTISLGTTWARSQDSLGLLVPSAVLPTEYNLLLNPAHAEYHKVTSQKVEPLDLDRRVLSQIE